MDMSYCHAMKKLTVTGINETVLYALAKALVQSPAMSADLQELTTFIMRVSTDPVAVEARARQDRQALDAYEAQRENNAARTRERGHANSGPGKLEIRDEDMHAGQGYVSYEPDPRD